MGSPFLETKHSRIIGHSGRKVVLGALLPIAKGADLSPSVTGKMASSVGVNLLGNSTPTNTTAAVSLTWASEIVLHGW